ncbi:MAG: DNA-binding protein [Rhodanobacter sp.]
MGKVGIATYDAVAAAADALLAEGRNPTVATVRAALDGGSPNTVLKHLNTWREQLGARFLALQRKDDVPVVLADGMQRLWDTALTQAHEQAQREIAGGRQSLADDRARLAQEAEAQLEREREQQRENERLRLALDTAQTQHAEQTQRIEQARRDLQAEQERTRQAAVDISRLSAETATLRSQVEHVQAILVEHRQAEDKQHGEDLARIDTLTQQLQAARQVAAQAQRKHEAAEKARVTLQAQSAELHGRLKALGEANAQLLKQLEASRGDLTRLATAAQKPRKSPPARGQVPTRPRRK